MKNLGMVFIVLLLLLSGGLSSATSRSIQAEVQQTSLLYFLENSHPVTGLSRDFASNYNAVDPFFDSNSRVASLASTGFSLATIAHASTIGMVTQDFAVNYALKTVRFVKDHVPRYRGWMLHWVDWETGERVWQSEYSTIDTALFMAGALYAAQVLPSAELTELTRSLYKEMDFIDFMTDSGANPNKRTLSLSYTPEAGYVPYQWTIYAEQMILLVLGLGHPTNPLPPEAWTAWTRQSMFVPLVKSSVMAYDMPLFIHQYSHVFLDFRNFKDGYPNYHRNSVLATSQHQLIAKTDKRFATFKAGFWGLSAGRSPAGYDVYSPTSYTSTVCIGCAAASSMFDVKVFQEIEKWKAGPYGSAIWGRYGITDSIDLDRNWFSPYVLGITVGPAYMAAANASNKSIWQDFMKIPEIKNGLRKAGNIGLQQRKLNGR